MKYIESWLKGLGLEEIIPKLESNGITTPKKLAALSLKDMYEVGKCRDGVWLALLFEVGPLRASRCGLLRSFMLKHCC
jgi:hypothetical protein